MRNYKVLVVSDAAYMDKHRMGTTGFGIVAGKVLEGLQSCGYHVAHFARGLRKDPKNPPSFMVYAPPSSDPNGYNYIGEVCEIERPDVIFMVADPGSIRDWRRNIEVRRVPNVVYTPTEGGPLLEPWGSVLWEIIESGGAVTTYTQFSQKVIEVNFPQDVKRPVEVLPHGIDHAPFARYEDAELRNLIRQTLGWEDKFVVLNVARNAGRKMLPRLMKASRIAKMDIQNLLLYLHTVAFENYILGGHNLKELACNFGMEQYVMFHSEMRDGTIGITYEGLGQGQKHIGLIDIYNAADLFVSTSGAEGWNMPVFEAAACGLPCAIPEYAGGWEAAKEFAAGIPILTFDTQPSGLEFGLVSPHIVAEAIVQLERKVDVRTSMSAKGQELAKDWKWQPTIQRLVEIIGEVI